MEDETLPPHMLPKGGGEVFLATEDGLFRVSPDDHGEFVLELVPTN